MHRVNCKEAYLLGRFFGDGWFEKRGVAFSTSSENEADLLTRLIQEVYEKKPSVKLRIYSDGHRVYWIRVWSKDLYTKYASIFGVARKKSLRAQPPDVEYENEDDILCFILGVFDAEGWIYQWYGKLRVSMEIYNDKIANYIRDMLQNLGLRPCLSRCRDGAYKLEMTGRQAKIFIEIVKRIRQRLVEP